MMHGQNHIKSLFILCEGKLFSLPSFDAVSFGLGRGDPVNLGRVVNDSEELGACLFRDEVTEERIRSC